MKSKSIIQSVCAAIGVALVASCGTASSQLNAPSGNVAPATDLGACGTGGDQDLLPLEALLTASHSSWFLSRDRRLLDQQSGTSAAVSSLEKIAVATPSQPSITPPDSVLQYGVPPLQPVLELPAELAGKIKGLSGAGALINTFDGKTVGYLGVLGDDGSLTFVGNCLSPAITDPLRAKAMSSGVTMLQAARTLLRSSLSVPTAAPTLTSGPAWSELAVATRQLSPGETPSSVLANLGSGVLSLQVPDQIRTDTDAEKYGICVRLAVAWGECSTLQSGLSSFNFSFTPGEAPSLWLIRDEEGFGFRAPVGRIGTLPATKLRTDRPEYTRAFTDPSSSLAELIRAVQADRVVLR